MTAIARRFLKRRTLVIAAVIVALAVGIVFASIPPHPPGPRPQTITSPVTHDVRGGTQNNPGVYALTLQNVAANASFAIGVAVTNGTATFCVMSQSNFLTWVFANSTPPGIPFSFNGCILRQQTAQSTLTFSTTNQGNWNVVAVNTNPGKIAVEFTPA